MSALELEESLVAAFPAFAAELLDEDTCDLGERTFHSVVREFAQFFARSVGGCSDQQLQWLGELIAAATAADGPLGNAWETCLLEHSRQLKVNRQLEKWLKRAG